MGAIVVWGIGAAFAFAFLLYGYHAGVRVARVRGPSPAWDHFTMVLASISWPLAYLFTAAVAVYLVGERAWLSARGIKR